MKLFGFNIGRKAESQYLTTVRESAPYQQFNSGEWQYLKLLRDGLFANPAVSGCVAAWSMTLNEAPLVVFDNGYQYDHPLSKLFKKPSPYMSGALLWQYVAMYAALSGNAYLYKIRNGFGDVIEFQILNDAQMSPIIGKDTSNQLAGYQYSFNNQRAVIQVQDIVHLRSHLPDPTNIYKGLSPIKICFRSIDSGNSLDEIIYGTLKNYATPNTIVGIKEHMTETQAKDMREQWKEKFSTRTKTSERETVAFLPADIEVKQIGMRFDQLEAEKLWTKFETAVCSAYRVHPIVAMTYAGLSTSTYSNMESAFREFTTLTRVPIWNLWEEQIQIGMSPEFPGIDLEFDTRFVQALQSTPNEKQVIAKDAFIANIITQNEARSLIGFEGIKGGERFSIQLQPVPPPSQKSFETKSDTKDISDLIEGMTEEIATKAWKSWDDVNESHAPKIAEAFSEIADELEAAYLRTVKAEFDWKAWEKRFIKGTEKQRLKLIEQVIAIAWQDAELVESLGTSYDVIVNKSIKESSKMIAESVGTIKDELRELLANNPEASGSEIADLIKGRFRMIKESRAAAIGRTTATATAEGTKEQVWKEANNRIDDAKRMIVRVILSRRDGHTRSGHLAWDGQAEDSDGMFTLNGNKTPYPAGAGLPAKDAVNCRCVTIAVRKGRLRK